MNEPTKVILIGTHPWDRTHPACEGSIAEVLFAVEPTGVAVVVGAIHGPKIPPFVGD